MAARGASLIAALEARWRLRLRGEARQARWEARRVRWVLSQEEARRFALESWEMFRMNDDKGSDDDGGVGERLRKVRVGAARGGEVGDSSGGSVVCSVCLEGLAAEEMPCKHLYHESCLAEWFKRSRTCPQCRYKMH
uniref:RING-type E3 ubiquitin transferase n=1 Tax=Kalanchoe fedtschenkoi TaxID=63787 RepID=A0A7N0USV2_KALFE